MTETFVLAKITTDEGAVWKPVPLDMAVKAVGCDPVGLVEKMQEGLVMTRPFLDLDARRWIDLPTLSRVLPDEAYDADMSDELALEIDDAMRNVYHTIPTEPGVYRDRDDYRWVFDGVSWTDSVGESRTVEWFPLLGLMGPWTVDEE